MAVPVRALYAQAGPTDRSILASNLEGALKAFVSFFIVVKTARTRDQSRPNWAWIHEGIPNVNSRPIEILVPASIGTFRPSIVRGMIVCHVGGGWTIRQRTYI